MSTAPSGTTSDSQHEPRALESPHCSPDWHEDESPRLNNRSTTVAASLAEPPSTDEASSPIAVASSPRARAPTGSPRQKPGHRPPRPPKPITRPVAPASGPPRTGHPRPGRRAKPPTPPPSYTAFLAPGRRRTASPHPERMPAPLAVHPPLPRRWPRRLGSEGPLHLAGAPTSCG